MSEKLEPCPFCGGEAEEIHYSEWGGPGNLAWLIRCTRCHAKMAGTHHDMNRAAWNDRAERTCEWTLAEQWENAEGNGCVYGYETGCGAPAYVVARVAAGLLPELRREGGEGMMGEFAKFGGTLTADVLEYRPESIPQPDTLYIRMTQGERRIADELRREFGGFRRVVVDVDGERHEFGADAFVRMLEGYERGGR